MRNKKQNSYNLFVKECIVTALIKLLEEKTLASISISELCQKAGVSRMSFYRNYHSREDILKQRLDEIFEEYELENDAIETVGIFCDRRHIKHYFDYISIHRAFFLGLTRCGLDVMFLDKINEYLMRKWSDCNSPAVLAAYCGSIYNMFHLLIDNGHDCNVEEMMDVLEKIYHTQK